MLNINIICVGKIKEKFFSSAIEEYKKRLSKYCKITITEIQDEKLPIKFHEAQLNITKTKECNKIIEAIKKDSYVIALDLSGKQYTSVEFSKKLENIALNFGSSVTFIIGGTLGLNEDVLKLANEKISFSKMTFPHQLFRIFLLEQIFRAFKIQNNETYHW